MKTRIVAILLTFFLGMLGIHKFYLNDNKTGLLYLILTLSVVGSIVSLILVLIDFFSLILMLDETFDSKYNGKGKKIAPHRELHFSKREAIDFGFNIAKKNFFYFISVFAVVLFVNAILGYFNDNFQNQGPIVALILSLIRIVIGLIISMGFVIITLKFVDGIKPKVTDIFYTKSILNYFLVSFIKAVIVFAGFILLIVPGIVFGVRLQFATYLVVDKNMGVTDALKKSWDMTRGKTINLLQFGGLLFLVNVVGLLALIVGLLITIPLSMVATAYVYRKLS